jgi:hypothetical protein
MSDPNESPPPLESAIELVGRTEQLRGQTVHAGVKSRVTYPFGNEPRPASELASAPDPPRDYLSPLPPPLDPSGLLH